MPKEPLQFPAKSADDLDAATGPKAETVILGTSAAMVGINICEGGPAKPEETYPWFEVRLTDAETRINVELVRGTSILWITAQDAEETPRTAAIEVGDLIGGLFHDASYGPETPAVRQTRRTKGGRVYTILFITPQDMCLVACAETLEEWLIPVEVVIADPLAED